MKKYLIIIIFGLIVSVIMFYSILDLMKIELEPIEDQSTSIDETTVINEPEITIENIEEETVLETEEVEEAQPIFRAIPINSETVERISGISYQVNGKIDIEDLRYLEISHYNYEGEVVLGEMIVHVSVAIEVLDIFKELYQAEFPIESMVLVDEYGASDEASMEANNTSAFNYRTVAGTNVLSNHAFGTAIDINPLVNPYVKGSFIQPLTGRDYLDRSKDYKGMIKHGDVVYNAFVSRGWIWGGDWNSLKDYQHFEKEID